MIIADIKEINEKLSDFKNYKCIVIICKYNGGKSSIGNELIHQHFGEENTFYVTFIDQSKPHFIPRKSRLKFNEMVNNKIIVFDEIDSDEKKDVKTYLKQLIENNQVIILTNPYGSSNNPEKEIELFKKHESDILPKESLFIFVRQKLQER
jgi:hypothetical protein